MYHLLVIRRLYIHNFRCLENFELPVLGLSSALLIGKNGAGKTAVALALEIFQRIARRTNRVRELIRPQDITSGRTEQPMRFSIEVELQSTIYEYVIAFELPSGFKELRVLDERLCVNGSPVYTRELATVHLAKTGQRNDASFSIDWHLVALPIVQEQSKSDPLSVFKRWLARMLILRPVPDSISGESSGEPTLEPNPHVTNFGEWFSGLLADVPSAYAKIDEYLKLVMPDLSDIKNPLVGSESRSLLVQFSDQQATATVPFEDLSDGEKCFMICALVLAANSAYGPLLCFWDEPENYLALSEVGQFVLTLRRAFRPGSQFIATSHNPEAIRKFSEENTVVLHRHTHLEPTVARRLSDIKVKGDLVHALIQGALES